MTSRLSVFFSVLVLPFALLWASPASAACVGAPDGKCDPNGGEDCACNDCLKACAGECTVSNPPACTLEDACTCEECWADEACTDPKKDNCFNDATCDFFLEGCLCDDCASLPNCDGFMAGAGGSGGVSAGGSGGTSAGGSTGGASGGAGGGGEGGVTLAKPDGGCGCTVAGGDSGGGLSVIAGAIAIGLVSRRRRRG